jgi:hypothetical protein
VSEIDAPIHVLAIISGFLSRLPLPETRATLAISVATDEDRLTITVSYRLTTAPRLFSALILRKQMPVVSPFFAKEVVAMHMIEHATIAEKSLRMREDYR